MSMSRFMLIIVGVLALVIGSVSAASTITVAANSFAINANGRVLAPEGSLATSERTTSRQDDNLKSDVSRDGKATLIVHVADSQGQAIEDASLRVFAWGAGVWEFTGVSGQTDSQGNADLSGIKSDQYSTLVIHAEGYASTAQDVELGENERRTLAVKLKPPVRGSIRIQDQHGEAIEGAILSELNFIDGEGGSYFHRFGIKDIIPFEPTISDADGVIQLPDTPKDAMFGLSVFHPDFVVKRVNDLLVNDQEQTTITLEEGIRVQFNLVPGPGTGKVPERFQSFVSIDPSSLDREGVSRIHHLATFINGRWSVTLAPAEYQFLLVRDDEDWTITPSIEVGDKRVEHLLKVRDGEPMQIDLMVRNNVTVQGKLLGDLSALGPNSYVYGETENLHPSLPLSDDGRRWAPKSFVDVESDGSFKLSLPAGRTRVKFAGLVGAVVEPNDFEIEIKPGEDVVLPDFRIRPVTGLRGRLVDEEGNAITNGVARLFVGFAAGDYVRCDPEGRFELSLDLVTELANQADQEVPVSIIGFDLDSNRSALVPAHVDLKTPMQEVRIRCELRDKGWLIRKIDEQYESSFATLGVAERRNRLLDENRSAFADGTVGHSVPELTKGTWLNTEQTSLESMRGKVVLLDFWFIGCGPCKADMPSVKLCHDVFPNDRFSVVSIHIGAQQTVDNVRQYAAQQGMEYPIVVEGPEREITEAYNRLGVHGYPSYILLGPDGRILHNDSTTSAPSLRAFKLETIRSVLD